MIPLLRLAAVALVALTVAAPVRAASLLRDPEIERGLTELAAPVLQAAGLGGGVRILVVDDLQLNAFVGSGQDIFIHSGLILKLETAAQLQSVIAHEAAHIANGHLARRMANMRSANRTAQIGMLLATAAAVSGESGAAGGIALGAASAAQRGFFAHTRAEEASADQSAARTMLRAGIDPAGSVEVLQIFRGQEALSVGRQDPYARTHPLTRDRLRAMQGFVAANPRGAPDAEADYWFARAQGKLSAFTQGPDWTLRRVQGDTSGVAAMRRAVAYHRRPDPARAIAQIDALAAATPTDAYVHDLRGQILLENRQVDAAIAAYARAVDLAPGQPLILGSYGRALLARNSLDTTRRALDVLVRARTRDGEDPRILRDLAVAYARTGQNGMASLTTAERYALNGRFGDVGVHARRALGLLPQGSTGWRRADDLVRAAGETGAAGN